MAKKQFFTKIKAKSSLIGGKKKGPGYPILCLTFLISSSTHRWRIRKYGCSLPTSDSSPDTQNRPFLFVIALLKKSSMTAKKWGQFL
jgi:hypothetical protein